MLPGPDDGESAEAPHVVEVQLATVGQPPRRPQVSALVQLHRLAPRGLALRSDRLLLGALRGPVPHRQPAGHAEVHDQLVVVVIQVERHEQVLATAAHAAHGGTDGVERREELRRGERPRVDQLGPDDERLQLSPDRLDLGQLGHVRSVARHPPSAPVTDRAEPVR